MPIAGTNIPLDSTEGMDKITVTEKVTSPYHSDGATELSSFITTSLSDTNEKYFFGISKTGKATTTEWNIAYGNISGYGADTNGGDINSATEAVYKQYANILLAPTEVTGGFFISRNKSTSAVPSSAAVSSGKDTEIYVLSSRRSLMKDRLNKKNWSIVLTGSLNNGEDGATPLHLTDDSSDDSPTATPVGDRYNIVSGSDGSISGSGAADTTYGFFYPDMGLLVFSGTELSASIPGSGSQVNSVARFQAGVTDITATSANNFRGFGTTTNVDTNYKNALRFVNCLVPTGGKISFRDEEDQVSAQFFCRVKAGHCNFSNNPTFISGSLNEIRQSTMKGNTTTYITQLQLYNSTGDPVAVASLSSPLKKNFSSEATIKVKLTY